MPAPSIDQQIQDVRKLLDLADRLQKSDQRLIGSLIVALSELTDLCEQLHQRLAAVEAHTHDAPDNELWAEYQQLTARRQETHE